jgi:DNA-binding response OmpR family regulator
VRHPNQVLSRSVILSAVWGYDYDPNSNVVDVYVSYLRRKLSEQGRPSPIVTMRGAGYRLDPALS